MESVWGVGNLPELGIVCGSGLHTLSSALDSIDLEIPFNEIPNFSSSSVKGHPGLMLFGRISNLRIVLLLGRLHYYEGHSPQKASYPILILLGLGISSIVLSNAAGGLSTDYSVGDIMLIIDHIYLAGISGMSPLVGPHMSIPELLSSLSTLSHFKALENKMDGRKSERFTPLNGIYSQELQKMFGQAIFDSKKMDIKRIHCGVYAYTAGPQYESPAETIALRKMGADAVGMSTVPEALIAAQYGLKLLAFSLITNEIPVHALRKSTDWLFPKDGENKETFMSTSISGPCHDEVIAAASDSTSALVSTMKRFCELYAIQNNSTIPA